ncbi:hypothetical protein NDU88_012367, partial [Pleurodeles waltl]
HSERLPVEEGAFPCFRYTPFVLSTPESNELWFPTVLCPVRQRDPPLITHIVLFIVCKVVPLLRKIGHGVRIQPPEPPGASRAVSCYTQAIPEKKKASATQNQMGLGSKVKPVDRSEARSRKRSPRAPMQLIKNRTRRARKKLASRDPGL